MDVIEYAGDDKSHVFLDHTSKLRNSWKRWCLYALNLYYIRLHIYYIQLHIHLHIFICCIDRMYFFFLNEMYTCILFRYKYIDRQIDRQIDRYIDKQTDR